ncbi:programmed cell death protein 5 [Nematocida sp. AWRm80]|nr:programmed cell death protein 5 [Nematocida sp. AWRm80]
MSMENEESKKKQTERIVEAMKQALSEESFQRLSNIKIVDLERYYKIEGIIIGLLQKGCYKIEDNEFLQILKSTEKQKKSFVYKSLSLSDLDD